MAGFPALARAKQLFLERKRVSSRQQLRPHGAPVGQAVVRRPGSGGSRTRPTNPGLFQSKRALECTAFLAMLCSDLDEQLRQIGNDVLVGSASIRREYQREVHTLDELTTALLDGHIDSFGTPRQGETKPKPRGVRVHMKKPRVKLQVVLRPKLPSCRFPQHHQSLIRTALLAAEAMNAQILQSHFRSYLYWDLYPGGPDQLQAVVQLAKRCSQARALRQWRRMVQQRRKLRERRDRSRQRLTRTAGSWARAKAHGVVQSEGKYAMAKEFQQAKLLARCFQAWLG